MQAHPCGVENTEQTTSNGGFLFCKKSYNQSVNYLIELHCGVAIIWVIPLRYIPISKE